MCDDPVCTLMISDESFKVVQTTCKLIALVENMSLDQTGTVERVDPL